MATRFSIDASATLTDRGDSTLSPKASSSLPEALQTHTTFNYKNYKAGRGPLGKTAFGEEALSGFFTRKIAAASAVRLSARPELFEAIDDWLNGRKL